MKQFTINEIITDSDGTVILIGKKGYLAIRRQNNNYSSANFCGYYIDNENTHKVLVAEIPSHPNRIVGGIAF